MDYTLFNAEDFAADESFNAYYLKTDATAMAFWAKWISLHAEKLDEIYNAEQLLAALYLRLDEEDLQSAFSKFDDFLQSETAPDQFYEKEKPAFFNVKKWATTGAFAIFLLIAGFYLKQLSDQKPVVYSSYFNGYGKTTLLTLSDGTKITLNSNTTLIYPKSFTANTREVELIGEAFFEVTKDKSRPFSVKTKGTKTTVLGTKFNISAYAINEQTKIALVEGKVLAEANAGKDKITLKPLEMATFSANAKTLTLSHFNLTEITGWKSGLMVFNHASFAEIAAKFQNSYGIALLDQSNTTKWSFSAQFNKADYLTVIKSICFSKNLKFKQTNNTITITQ